MYYYLECEVWYIVEAVHYQLLGDMTHLLLWQALVDLQNLEQLSLPPPLGSESQMQLQPPFTCPLPAPTVHLYSVSR